MSSILSPIEFPKAVEFEFCSIGSPATKSFSIFNPSSQPSKFCFKSELFHLEPARGILNPKQRQEIVATYTATEAKTIIEAVRVNVNEDWGTMKLTAVGKYPYIGLSTHRIDFGDLLVGMTATKEITLKNPSLVPAEFVIEKMEKDKDVIPAFTLDIHKSTIPANSSYVINIKYTPSVVGLYSCTHYKVSIKGGNEDKFTCSGTALGMEVNLSAKSIHFGEVTLGNTTNRVLYIHNYSALPACFQFVNDKKNAFSFSKKEGIIKPRSDLRIVITFAPTDTINFYERVFCIVKNHMILYVDLLGTCYDLLHKPYPLYQRHVDMLRYKIIMGIHKGPPAILEEKKAGGSPLSEKQKHADENGGLEINEEIPIDDPNLAAKHKEMFLENNAESRDVFFTEEIIDFGYTQSGVRSESKEITIHNKLNYDIQGYWIIPSTPAASHKVNFIVNPVSFEVPRQSEKTLKVSFAPSDPNHYYFHQLQCYAFRKTGYENKFRDISLEDPTKRAANEVTLTRTALTLKKYKKRSGVEIAEEVEPPICLSIPVVGHSFPPGAQPFLPMLELDPGNKINFLPASLEEPVYQTIQLNNKSDTPIYYKMLPDPSRTFRIFPSNGVIEGQSFSLICFEFCPRKAQTHSFVTQCILNHSPNYQAKIQLIGYCYLPLISIAGDKESKIYYPPTFMGVASKEKIIIRNDALISCDVNSFIPEKYRSEISFLPDAFRLKGNEEKEVSCTFIPKKAKAYSVTAQFIATGNSRSVTNVKEVLILGAGADGYIEISPDCLNYGTVKVGDEDVKHVTLHNKSKANVYVELSLVPEADSDSGESLISQQFKYEFVNGVIHSHSKKVVAINFKPKTRCRFKLMLTCVTKDKPTTAQGQGKKKVEEESGVKQKACCKILANGDFPLIKLMDIRNESVSTSLLCDSFSFGDLNGELLSPLNAQEQEFNNADQTSKSVMKLQKDLKCFEWNFGKMPLNAKSEGMKLPARKVVITLKNVGGVNARFVFRKPNESDVELEPWMDPGEPTPEQYFESQMLQNGLFEVEPQCSEEMKPGEQIDIEARYYPKLVGQHYLKIFFQVLNGKPLFLKFAGETLPPSRGYLQLRKTVFTLPPTPINLNLPVTYPLEIKNLGSYKLEYEIDESPLSALSQSNYNFEDIFYIPRHKNKKIQVAPGKCEYIYVMFHPIEAKRYYIELPISVKDINGTQSAMLKIEGSGYHPDPKKEVPVFKGMFCDAPLCRSNIPGKGSEVSFSLDEIDFGVVDQNMPSRNMIYYYWISLVPASQYFEIIDSHLSHNSDDVLFLEPFQGQLLPGAHVNIKMTLKASPLPSSYEGEIECQVNWLNRPDEEAKEGNNEEFLYLRIRKRPTMNSRRQPTDNLITDEPLLDNILTVMIKDILDDPCLDEMNEKLDAQPTPFFPEINNDPPPGIDYLKPELVAEEESKKLNAVYESGVQDINGWTEVEKTRKELFLDEDMAKYFESIFDNTVFNIIQEATHGECDLMKPPKTYIEKAKK